MTLVPMVDCFMVNTKLFARFSCELFTTKNQFYCKMLIMKPTQRKCTQSIAKRQTRSFVLAAVVSVYKGSIIYPGHKSVDLHLCAVHE